MMLPTVTVTAARLRHYSCRSDTRFRAVWMPATFLRQQLSRSRNSNNNNHNHNHNNNNNNTSCSTNRNYGAITATAPTAQHPPIRSNMLRGRPSIAVSVLSTVTSTHGHERRARTSFVVFDARASSSSQRRGIVSEAVLTRMQRMVDRHEEILQEMEAIPETAFTYGQELASLSRIVALQNQRTTIATETSAVEELRDEAQVEQDRDLEEECQQELFRLQEQGTRLETRIRDAILPNDEQDVTSDAIVEIRPGTGGEEASMFAAELKAAYEQTTKSLNKGWTFEILQETKTDLNGIKESVIAISSSGGRGGGGGGGGYTTPAPGDDEDEDDDATNFLATIGPYGLFRYESGVHRVQRVPRNDTRIHTSACSVAVLPSQPQTQASAELLPMSELKVETMRSSGAGGQHVNCTDSAVRITHVPTGLTASIQDERSQHKNRAKAMKLITARVLDVQQAARDAEHATTKSNLLGSGDRSERIRTYNYPQDRISDHRCKHTTYGIAKLFQGTSGSSSSSSSSSSSDDNSGTGVGSSSSTGGGGGLVAEFYPYLRDMVREEQLAALEQEEQENKNNQTTDNNNTNTKNKKKKKR